MVGRGQRRHARASGAEPYRLMRDIQLYDATLRDGMGGGGMSLTAQEKLRVVHALDALGIHLIEAGFPASNPKELELFALLEREHFSASEIVAFGMTRRRDAPVEQDEGLRILAESFAPVCTLVGKSSPLHVEKVVRVSPEENLAMISESVAFLHAQGKRVLFDAEHFFDGYAADPAYALDSLRAAAVAGAERVVLCDTNGGSLPGRVRAVVEAVRAELPDLALGIHTHDDGGCAVANTLVAVEAGATQVQGTINGIGERTGNANLITIIADLQLKMGAKLLAPEQLARLTATAHFVDELLNRSPDRHAPYVGESAFATKAGIHASAIVKEPATYEHVAPERVGNKRKLLVSDQAGRSNVLAELDRIGLKIDRNDARVTRLLDEVKEREAIGYAYEAADASFELLARRSLGQVPHYFDVEKFDVNVEKRTNAKGEPVTVSQAVVKIKVGDEELISVAEGIGPVNALDLALRKDLGKYQSFITGLTLTDYRVRILNGGTQAVTRVLIESSDETGDRWTTVGVSANIIDASFQALMDSIVYKLVKSGAPA